MHSKFTRMMIIALTILAAFGTLAYLKTNAVSSQSSTAEIYENPSTSTGAITENFTVNTNTSNVADLYGWEVRLEWNSTVLDVLEVTEGPFLNSQDTTFFTSNINNTGGYLIADCTLLGDVAGVSGSGVLLSVEFNIENLGQTDLNLNQTLNQTQLINSLEQPIQFTTSDGYFYTYLHDINIVEISVSPTTVNVIVDNLGTQAEVFNVSAYYTLLSDPLIGTQTVTLQSQGSTTLIFSWHPSWGLYRISAEVITDPSEINMGNSTQTENFHLGLVIGTDNEHVPN